MLLNFYQNIYQTLSRQPGQVYLRWPLEGGSAAEMRSFTGAALLQHVAAYQQLLKKHHIRIGDPILLALPVGIDLICGLLACMGSGAVPVLPPAGARPGQLLAVIRKQKIKGLLTATPLLPGQRLLLWLLGVKVLHLQEAAKAEKISWKLPVPVAEEQAALISHSSGSTGQPKAIYRSHKVLLAQHLALKAQFPPLPAQRDFPLFPNILLHNLSLGVLSILPALPAFDVRQMNPALLVAQLQQEGVHTLTGNVYYFKKLLAYLEAEALSLPGVQALGIGGSPVPEPLLRRLQARFPAADLFVIYGASEAEPIAVRKVSPQTLPPALGYAVGPFCASLEWKLLPLPQQEGMPFPVGEIAVRGAHVATKETGGWLHTGDFGYVNEAGVLFLTARRGNETPHGGVQHYQLEHLLLHQPGVEQAAARSGTEGFEVWVQGSADREALRKVLESHFPTGIVLALHFREGFPMDSRHHSKILYPELR
jgi:olefin beta-lactone synthetase